MRPEADCNLVIWVQKLKPKEENCGDSFYEVIDGG